MLFVRKYITTRDFSKVPKAWFTHFYQFAVLYQGILWMMAVW